MTNGVQMWNSSGAQASSYYLVASSYCLNLLPHHVASLPWSHCFIALPCYLAMLPNRIAYLIALPFTTWLPLHLRYLLTPPQPAFDVLLPYTWLPHRIATSLPCWMVLPSSLLFLKGELGAWRSNHQRRLVFLFPKQTD